MALFVSFRRRGLGSSFVLLICAAGVLFCYAAVLYLATSLQQADCDCSNPDGTAFQHSNGHSLAILVPIRDRFEELQEFVVYMSKFLKAQGVKYHIFAINQVDSLRFNRATLLNVGFRELGDQFDYVALHDVDLLPANDDLLYHFPEKGPVHLAAPHLHPRYHYPAFIGGVLLLTKKHFSQVDGLSNVYWGWGLEDDEFYARLKEARLKVLRPGNLTTGTKSFRHIHDRRVRRRDQIRCYDQHLITRRRDRRTGLSNTRYSVLTRRKLLIDGCPVTILNVELTCSRAETPWCDCTHSTGNSGKEKREALLRDVPPEDVIAPKLNRKIHISPDG